MSNLTFRVMLFPILNLHVAFNHFQAHVSHLPLFSLSPFYTLLKLPLVPLHICLVEGRLCALEGGGRLLLYMGRGGATQM